MINDQSRTHRGRRRLPYTRATAPDTQQRALGMKDSSSSSTPRNFFIKKKGQLDRTQTNIEIFFWFCCAPNKKKKKKKREAENFSGFLEWLFLSLSQLVHHSDEKFKANLAQRKMRPFERIFQPSSSSIISVCVCVCTQWVDYTHDSAGF